MQKEVEMKCHITAKNKPRIQNFLKKNCKSLGSVEKHDLYFSDPKDSQKIFFRIRTEKKNSSQAKYRVTKKQQSITPQGIEINDELEFEVSSHQYFVDFCEAQGIKKMFTKIKKIKNFLYQDMLIEWGKIPLLGEFLEVEIVTSEKKVPEAVQKISDFFNHLNLQNDIEKRPYFVLLQKAKR